MTVLVPFVLNALVNFVLGLLVALFLGPAEFGRYAIGASLLVFVSVVALDWIKLSAIRFYAQGADGDGVRSTLDGLAALVTLGLSGLLVAAVIGGADLGLPVLLVVASVVAGLCGGLFDYGGAVARARRQDRAYALLVIIKNLLALGLMAGGAFIFRDATLVLAGNALSLAAALLVVRRRLGAGEVSLRAVKGFRIRQFGAYAFPLVAANILYVSLPLSNRALLAGQHGFAEAGQFALAADMGLKLFGTLGAAIEIIVLRLVVETDAAAGRAAAEAAAARFFTVSLMIVAPVATGLWLVLPGLEALVIPPAFRGSFSTYFLPLLPGFAAMAVMAAGINPLFMVTNRTWPTTLAAALAVGVAQAVIWWLAAGSPPQVYAWSMGLGFGMAFLVLALLALRHSEARPSRRDLALIVLAVLVMVGVVWPMRARLDPLGLLGLGTVAGAAVYGTVLWLGNVAGLRTELARLRR